MFAVVYVPSFSLQAVLRHEPALVMKPVALVDPLQTKTHIVQLNRAALKQGVAIGLTVSQAMARCGDLLIKTRSLSQEEAATGVLLQTAYAFSARIEATSLGACTLSLQGLKLEHELETWAEKIRLILSSLQMVVQIGVAITPGLALLAARNAKSVSVIRDAATFVADMPVEALEPEPKILEILQRWGIRTAGVFISLGKDKVLERLGAEALSMFERVSPSAMRPLRMVFPSETFSEQMEFEAEIETIEPLLFILRRFVEQLSRRLEVSHLVVAELQLRLDLASGANYRHAFPIPAPTGNVDTLFRMLQTHLENVRTDAPIVRLELTAIPAKPDLHQFGLFETTLRNPNQFAETLAR
ncbi:MAG: Nucleotidyltransferase/DNA polymerase involved in repair-like protein, partial [Verrucomicrobia bacterium]|nr:Nucleotidyltransferase/DNA polymerase involved in repair-like protein [Verrucomicrobiota bacterium]